MSTTASGEVRNISHIVLHSADLHRSIAFYQLLGFEVNRIISTDPGIRTDLQDMSTIPLNQTAAGDFKCVGMSLGTEPRAITALEIMQWDRPVKTPRAPAPELSLGMVRLALNVTGIQAIRTRVQQQGHPVGDIEHITISPTLSSVYMHLHDPDGNWLTLMEWIKSKPADSGDPQQNVR